MLKGKKNSGSVVKGGVALSPVIAYCASEV